MNMKLSRALFKRVQGYSTPRQRWLSYKQRMGFPSQAEQWAEAIAARYKFYEQRWPFLGYELAQTKSDGISILNQNNTHYASVLVNPRMLLRLLISHQHASQHIQPVRREITQHNVPMYRESASQVELPNVRQEKIEIVTRILRQSVRNENMPTTPKLSVMRPSSLESSDTLLKAVPVNLQTPVSKVFRQGSPTPEREPDISNAPAGFNKSSTLYGSPTTKSQIPAAVDINHITDQVMQALDQRIIAQRERLGRI
jgi:hypothetical protein